MFKLIGKLFGGKNPVDSITGMIDQFSYSKEEKAQFKLELEKFFAQAEMEMQKEVSDRWKYDMQSDSWMSKNIRPLVLAYLVAVTSVLIVLDAVETIQFKVADHWVSLLTTILVTVIAAYFGGRSVEKARKNRKQDTK